jgi:hypothetical protein
MGGCGNGAPTKYDVHDVACTSWCSVERARKTRIYACRAGKNKACNMRM